MSESEEEKMFLNKTIIGLHLIHSKPPRNFQLFIFSSQPDEDQWTSS
jgi:hypothetical protein